MKKLLFISLLSMFSVNMTIAQYKEISGTMGLLLNSSGESEYGTIDIANGWVLGGTFGYDIADYWQAELFWNMARASTNHSAGDDPATIFDMTYQNIHLGVNRYFGEYDDFVPYVGLSTGVTLYDPKTETSGGKTLWSLASTVGFKIFPVPDHPRWGFKTHFRLYIPMAFDGRELFTDEAGDSGLLVPVIHGEFSGGFVYRFLPKK
ncbi:MAG: outer membrane beta-barrel protein [Reichenbachiella sp.]